MPVEFQFHQLNIKQKKAETPKKKLCLLSNLLFSCLGVSAFCTTILAPTFVTVVQGTRDKRIFPAALPCNPYVSITKKKNYARRLLFSSIHTTLIRQRLSPCCLYGVSRRSRKKKVRIIVANNIQNWFTVKRNAA